MRPAKTAPMAKRAPARIQYRAGSGGAWKTLRSVSSQTTAGYFDVTQAFPGSGSVRLQWTYPSGQVIYSRTVSISLH